MVWQSSKRAGVAAGNYVIELNQLAKNGIFDESGLVSRLGDKFLEVKIA